MSARQGAVVPLAPHAIGSLAGRLNEAAGTLDHLLAVVAAIAATDDPDVPQYLTTLWQSVDEVAWKTWQVRAAIIYHATAHATRQRGIVDTDQAGVVAVTTAVAAEIGVSFQLAYADRRIHERLSGCYNDYQNLRERAYWDAAARTPDPAATIAAYSERKAADPGFNAAIARHDAGAARRLARHAQGQHPAGAVVYESRYHDLRVLGDTDAPTVTLTVQVGDGAGGWLTLDLHDAHDAREAAQRLATELVYRSSSSSS